MESTQHSTGPLDLRPTRPVLDLREWTDEQWQEWSKWQAWSEQPQEPKVVPATVHQPQQQNSHTPKVVPATRPQPQQQSGQHEPKVVIDLTSSEEFVSKMPQQCEMSQSVPLVPLVLPSRQQEQPKDVDLSQAQPQQQGHSQAGPIVVPARYPQQAPAAAAATPVGVAATVVPATVPQPQQSSDTPKVVPATRPQPQQQSGQHEPKVVIDLTSSEEFVSKMPQQCEMSQSVPLVPLVLPSRQQEQPKDVDLSQAQPQQQGHSQAGPIVVPARYPQQAPAAAAATPVGVAEAAPAADSPAVAATRPQPQGLSHKASARPQPRQSGSQWQWHPQVSEKRQRNGIFHPTYCYGCSTSRVYLGGHRCLNRECEMFWKKHQVLPRI